LTKACFWLDCVESQRGETSHLVHGQVMSDAILPAFDIWILSFVCIFPEPVVYILKNHGVVRGLFEASENSLRIWLISVQIVILAWRFDLRITTKRCRWAAVESFVICES